MSTNDCRLGQNRMTQLRSNYIRLQSEKFSDMQSAYKVSYVVGPLVHTFKDVN